MNAYFADTQYYLALLHAGDEAHASAVALTARIRGRIVTTEWVLAEIGNALSPMKTRAGFTALLSTLARRTDVEIVPAGTLFERGAARYSSRADKEWSLVDCISFIVMEDYGIRDALTADRHFEQAGFQILLK